MSDKIEKRVTLRAPVGRVWQAITDAKEFSTWFGFTLEGPFVAGKTVKASFDMDFDEAEIMAYQKSVGLEPAGIRIPKGCGTFCTVERIEPEHYFSFRWVPYWIDAEADPENEPTTLVEFRLAPCPEGTLLTIVESGFDRVPKHRRARAFRMNVDGWDSQAEKLVNHVQGK